MVNLNKINYKVEKGARKFVSEMGKGGYAPIILLEGAVVAGRTEQAKKRGGFVEARERFTEEILGSIFWLGGVAGFNKLGNILGKKIFKLKDINFDVGQDHARKPFQNFVAKIQKTAQKSINFEKMEKNLAAFKFTKMITSVLLANAVIGIVVPKINQAITRKQQEKKKASEAQNQAKRLSIDEFLNKTNKNKDVAFKGFGAQQLLNATNFFEQDASVKLLSTDVGTTTGRAANARNKHERIEILFRDIASVYFYLFCKKHLNSALNYLQDGRTTRLDPTSAEQLDSHIKSNFKNKSYSAEEFEKLVLGDKNAQIPSALQDKFKDGNKIITLEEFEQLAGKESAEAKIARKMSRIQPELPTGAILTESQVKDVYAQGLINDPRFLNKVYRQATYDRISKTSASSNPHKFVAEAELLQLKAEMTNYVESIAKKAKAASKNITLETLTKANKQNFAKNTLNLGAGFAVSALFLSTLIPKIQYWITKQQTGQDKFPGVE